LPEPLSEPPCEPARSEPILTCSMVRSRGRVPAAGFRRGPRQTRTLSTPRAGAFQLEACTRGSQVLPVGPSQFPYVALRTDAQQLERTTSAFADLSRRLETVWLEPVVEAEVSCGQIVGSQLRDPVLRRFVTGWMWRRPLGIHCGVAVGAPLRPGSSVPRPAPLAYIVSRGDSRPWAALAHAAPDLGYAWTRPSRR
jgi:hypothetical protein